MPIYLTPLDSGRPIVIDKAVIFIGRHPECDLVITHSRKVSRKHCCIAQVDSRLVIRDLGSMNGVRLNGTRVQKDEELRAGDELSIGDVGYVVCDGKTQPRREPPAAPRPPAAPSRKTPPPLDISRDYPVAIPDSGPASDARPPRPGRRNERDSSDDEALLMNDTDDR